jgi:hypothetical protein
MYRLLLTLTINTFILSANTSVPQDKKYYISGIEFDTKIYCADFAKVIEEQDAKIAALEAEVERLRDAERKRIQEAHKKAHTPQKKTVTTKKEPTKSKIIISDTPL